MARRTLSAGRAQFFLSKLCLDYIVKMTQIIVYKTLYEILFFYTIPAANSNHCMDDLVAMKVAS